MTVAWALVALAVAIVPLGSARAARLDALSRTVGDRGLPGLRVGAGLATGAAVGGIGVVAWLGGVALGLAAALTVITAAALVNRLRARRAAEREDRAAVEIVHLVRAEVEAGTPPADAVRAATVVGHFGPELTAIADAVDQARDPVSTIPPPLLPLAHALRVSASSGAALSGVLGVVSLHLEHRVDRSRSVATALAGARASAAVLAVLPLVGLALGASLGANPVGVLVGTSGGRVLVLIGVGLECLGLMWTARLAASAERA